MTFKEREFICECNAVNSLKEYEGVPRCSMCGAVVSLASLPPLVWMQWFGAVTNERGNFNLDLPENKNALGAALKVVKKVFDEVGVQIQIALG